MLELESSSPEETERIAARVARDLAAGDVVTVAGELGTGKTTFVRGACRALGVSTPVTSPTYTIGHRYVGNPDVSHLDLYRFERVSELDWADLEPYFDAAIAFVEWPDRAAAFIPAPRVRVGLRLADGDRRVILLEGAEKSLQRALSSQPC